jgi:sarcosine oxidase subunit beta
MAEIPQRADVVVVGGGAIGASTVFHLVQAGVTDVVLLERGQLAGGSTAKSAGGARLQFADELNIRVGLRSFAELEGFDALIGEHVDFVPDIAFRQVGYLFLLDAPDQLEIFRQALALQASLGVPSRELTPAEAGEMVPQLELDGILAATFCPRDGHMSPEAVVQGYAAAAAARGAKVAQGVEVTAIEHAGGAITGVVTAAGRIATDTVVCAAGAWSNEVGAMVDVEIPVRGEPHWMYFSPEHGGLPDRMPLTIDFGTGFYAHREGPGIVFGGREPTIEEIAEHALRRLPVIGELPIQSSWWGYYDDSPDHNAIVGEASVPGRFLYATGFSGHGFQQAPAVGEHLAELVTGRTPTLDLSAFALERFAQGVARDERFIV